MKVPFIDLTREANFLLKEILIETEKVITTGQYINGPKVKEFEKEFANFCNVKNAISVGNGSDGLTFIIRALGIGEGDEIICPANSFIASAWSIVAAGAKPVFCDVEDDFLISISKIKGLINSSTKAIMPVHLTGKLCNMQPLIDFANDKNIFLIEDAAQAIGASDDKGFKSGCFGIAASFSLHPLKNLSVYGDGGMVTTNNDDLANKIRLLRNHGLKNRDECIVWGFNSRLDELQACYGLLKLKFIDEWTERYIEIAEKYSKGLNDMVIKPKTNFGYKDVFHNYIIQVQPESRDSFMSDLLDLGVETKIHYPIPLHLQKCATQLNYSKGDLPNVEKLASSMISLPIYPLLSEEEIDYVISCVNLISCRLM